MNNAIHQVIKILEAAIECSHRKKKEFLKLLKNMRDN